MIQNICNAILLHCIYTLYYTGLYVPLNVYNLHCVYNGFLLNIVLLLCCPAICTDGCDNGGTCVDPEMCECPSNWQGQKCDDGESLFA